MELKFDERKAELYDLGILEQNMTKEELLIAGYSKHKQGFRGIKLMLSLSLLINIVLIMTLMILWWFMFTYTIN